jgi:diacylglycerol O-acyltransferase / wax synthase
MPDTLTALDATLLELEQQNDGAVMTIGAVMVFEPAAGSPVPSIDEVRALISSRLSDLPRYRQRLSSTRPGRWSWPHWIDDERFDLANHVARAALPTPGGDDELSDWIAEFYSHRLDRARPLWEIVLLEGLEGGRWALALKLYHCLLDELGAAGAAERLLDAEPNPGPNGSLRELPDERVAVWRSLVPTLPLPLAQATRAGGSAGDVRTGDGPPSPSDAGPVIGPG